MEFESIYRKEAAQRKVAHGKPLISKGDESVSNGDGVNEGGRFTKFMTRDPRAVDIATRLEICF